MPCTVDELKVLVALIDISLKNGSNDARWSQGEIEVFIDSKLLSYSFKDAYLAP